ncbi:Na+/H+ antiporter subunit E [Allorhodopirellula solitaria]|uniref:Na+/H+ antiporter subunit E n=1 Tax=Allorhodopirellula solitaria TaxID=2527987 RepID=UPI0011B6A879|nr:Na+/H+ antiporter subunit E [Allorhodopirellula solitaria]
MKNGLALFVALLANWLLWSGHFDNAFLIALGIVSCWICLWLTTRMRIVDEEGAPAHLGLLSVVFYAIWLTREIVRANIAAAKIILSPVMPLRRNLIRVPANQKSELGRVVFANSITLTPGTVAVRLRGNEVLVHGLALLETKEDMSGGIGRRVCRLERSGSDSFDVAVSKKSTKASDKKRSR